MCAVGREDALATPCVTGTLQVVVARRFENVRGPFALPAGQAVRSERRFENHF
jgi:hypothetical protein